MMYVFYSWNILNKKLSVFYFLLILQIKLRTTRKVFYKNYLGVRVSCEKMCKKYPNFYNLNSMIKYILAILSSTYFIKFQCFT